MDKQQPIFALLGCGLRLTREAYFKLFHSVIDNTRCPGFGKERGFPWIRVWRPRLSSATGLNRLIGKKKKAEETAVANCQDIRCSLHLRGGRLTILHGRASERLALTVWVTGWHLKITHQWATITGSLHTPIAAAGEKAYSILLQVSKINNAHANKSGHHVLLLNIKEQHKQTRGS